MTKNHYSILIAGILSATIPMSVNAALEQRLGGKAYYDTETNLTWTTDASPNGYKTYFDQINFAENLAIDGVTGWQMPTSRELLDFIGQLQTCLTPDFCTFPPEPFHHISSSYFLKDGYYHSVNFKHNIEIEITLIYRPYSNDYVSVDLSWFTGDERPAAPLASSWPVYHGDVALIPEPSAYAMLLAGLGLMAFRRNRLFKLTNY